MGEVYRAYDPGLDRMIAIKRLRGSDNMGARARQRLLREAQVVARLCHSNVVQVFDVGVDDVSEDAFIGMELVDGQTLREWLRQRRTWQEIVEVFLHAGRGLMAAHSRGVVHRDFKPENVLLGEEGVPKVVDFGLAKPALDRRSSRPSGEPVVARSKAITKPNRSAEEDDSRRATNDDLPVSEGGNTLTPAGARLGTPAYMPAEQIRSMPSDPRSDQFAFAVSLYEALTGQLPFKGRSKGKYAKAVLDGDVQPFPRRSPVPRRLRKAIVRAMAYRPEDRYRTMQPLLVELERALQRPGTRRISLVAATVFGVVLGLGASTLLDFDDGGDSSKPTPPRRTAQK